MPENNDRRLKNGRSADDTSEYAGSLAPETRREAERESRRGDERVMPGSPTGVEPPVGMPGMDRDEVPSGATDADLTRPGDTDDETR